MAMQVLCLTHQAVQAMIEERPLWYRNFSTLMLWNLDSALQTAIDLLIKDPKARVCARLLTLCGQRAQQAAPKEAIELPLTQDQFAGMCGLSRKSVHVALNRLEAEGLCENRYGTIVVPNAEELKKSLMSLGAHSD